MEFLAPIVPASLVWVDPRTCTHMTRIGGARMSGVVHPGDWDRQVQPIGESVKIAACIAHWRDGVPWANTGIYDHMLAIVRRRGKADACRSLVDIIRRYQRMDRLYETIARDGFLTAHALGRTTDPQLEPGGIVIHAGRDRAAIFSGSGSHRLAIALVLGLTRIPAQIGAVHPEALRQSSSFGGVLWAIKSRVLRRASFS